MDVRCDRCQTEYELDDASVTAGGASVQCTTCGHTFVVGGGRPGGTPAPVPQAQAAGTGTGTPTPSWMLTTEEGKTHRFRDSQTLQKWVVERRVSRADRVCPPGGAWRRLGDVDELRPFFDVVAQADRAAAAVRGSRPTRPETPRATGQSRPYVSADLDDDDVLTGGRVRRPALSEAFDTTLPNDDLEAAGIGTRRPGRKVGIAVVLALVALAAYVGFNGTGALHLPWSTPASPPSAAPAAPPVAMAPAAASAAAPAAASAAAPAPAPTAPVAPSPPVAAPPPPPPATLPPPSAPAPVAPAPTGPSPSMAAEEPAPGRPAPHDVAVGGEARPKNYDHLIAEADRAIENGKTAQAQKLYDEALKLEPNGVAAVTGSAYVLLDKQKPLAAIDSFKRALAAAPSFAPALFGLGEAYRLEGEPAPAIAAYKRYLEASPGGSDAPAARRQIRELESQSPTPSRAEAPAPSSSPISAPAPTEPP
jgi:predicted Zn finger-like uncharacterized protein